jgi:hypothetical protein
MRNREEGFVQNLDTNFWLPLQGGLALAVSAATLLIPVSYFSKTGHCPFGNS